MRTFKIVFRKFLEDKAGCFLDLWTWCCDEKNARGLTLLILIVVSIWGIIEIRTIAINLTKIRADSIEAKMLTAPPGEKLMLGLDKKTGLPVAILDQDGTQPVIQLGSIEDSARKPCIQMSLPGQSIYVHLSPKVAGSVVVWEAGQCPN